MKKILGIHFVLLISIATLQAQLSINADISPRAELRHGYRLLPSPDDKPAAHVNQRTRLALNWQKDKLRTRISLQDIRIWGEEAQKQIIPSLAIHEAWVELLLSDAWFVKVGRQELTYDNQRFFAKNDWVPASQKHDLVLMKYESLSNKLHLGTAFNQENTAYTRTFGTQYRINNYKFMSFLWYNITLGNNGNMSLLAIADGFENISESDGLEMRGTWSALARYNFGAFDLMVNPAFQHGNTVEGTDIMAWYFRSELGKSLAEGMNTALGIEMISGNSPTDASTFRVFNPSYGAGHANNGYMDYFTDYPSHSHGAGLINPFLKNRIRLTEKTNLDAHLHLFYLQNDYRINDGEINKYLGTEIDLVLNYKFNEFTNIIGGASYMFASESMQAVKGGSKDEPAYFTYIMLRVRPQLL